MGTNFWNEIEALAKKLQKDPQLKKAFDSQIKEKGFKETVDKLSEEVKDLFQHDDKDS